MRAASPAPGSARQSSYHWLLLGLLGGTLLVLFLKSLSPNQILFANDFPLGALKAECNQLPGRFAGTWRDLTWLGGEAAAASPDITMLVATMVSPVAYLKLYAPFTLLFLGFSAWLFFRQLNFNPVVCVLGGVAAGLNGHFFSLACWGLGHWNIGAGCSFLAMAAFYAKAIPKVWERAVLAGLAVGMGVMEGYDVGAILSIYAGVFILFRFLNDETPLSQRVVGAVIAETLVVLFAAIIAAHTMLNLVETQVEGVASMEQDVETKASRWNPATQWSLPKMETLQIFIPGIFGYRLSGNIDQKDHSGAYWGRIGQDPRIDALGSDDPVARSNIVSILKLPDTYLADLNTSDRYSRTEGMVKVTKKSGIYWRYSGSGECAGAIVSLLAVFGLANFFRKDGPFAKSERVAVGYWGGVALFSLLAAWGRFGFVYQFLYRLPYFSTIRNPIKFLHPFHIAWVILAAYGMEGLYRRYMRGPDRNSAGWWAKAAGFDRKWIIFMMILAGASVVGAAMLYASKDALVRYLHEQSFSPALAGEIPDFCAQRAWAFVVILAAGMLVLAGVLSGFFTGSGHKWAWAFLGALIIGDLARADIPWIHYYDYKEKYSLNPVVEFLMDKPWEHRAIGKLEPRGPGSGIQPGFGQLYFFWLQNDFPYHEIQNLDFPQFSHMPDLDRLYLKSFELGGTDIRTADLRPAVRLWQLTNTRYVLATASAVDMLNTRADPVHHSFALQGRFSMRPKPGLLAVGDIGDYTVESNPKGEFGIIEYPRTLPRAKLYANWRTPTNDDASLQILTNQDFEPLDTVLVAPNTPVKEPNSTSTADPGTVTITDYHPKHVRLEAEAKTAAILLLNDRFGVDWRVSIDGAPANVLRCNYIMRGVYLTPGHHMVEFRFSPSLQSFYLSVSAIFIGIILAGYLIVTRKGVATPETPGAPPPPAAPPTRPPAAGGPTKGGDGKDRPPRGPGGPSAPGPAKIQKGNGKTKGAGPR
jgi:hypothetical protein